MTKHGINNTPAERRAKNWLDKGIPPPPPPKHTPPKQNLPKSSATFSPPPQRAPGSPDPGDTAVPMPPATPPPRAPGSPDPGGAVVPMPPGAGAAGPKSGAPPPRAPGAPDPRPVAIPKRPGWWYDPGGSYIGPAPAYMPDRHTQPGTTGSAMRPIGIPAGPGRDQAAAGQTPPTAAQVTAQIKAVQHQIQALSATFSPGMDLTLSPEQEQCIADIRALGGMLSDLQALEARLQKQEREALVAQGWREPTLWDTTVGSLGQGILNAKFGQESYKALQGNPNNAEHLRTVLEGDAYRVLPGGPLQRGVSGASALLGQMMAQTADPMAWGTGAAYAGIAAAAGQAGPQVALPEEVITVPAAFTAGLGVGSAAVNYQIEAGLAYDELRQNGVSHETAGVIASCVGAGNAALELVQLDELLDAAKILGKNPATRSAANRITGYITNYAGDVGRNVTEELLQEGVSILGQQAGTRADTGRWAYTGDEVRERFMNTLLSSALTFSTLNLPKAGHTADSKLPDGKTTAGQEVGGAPVPDKGRAMNPLLPTGPDGTPQSGPPRNFAEDLRERLWTGLDVDWRERNQADYGGPLAIKSMGEYTAVMSVDQLRQEMESRGMVNLLDNSASTHKLCGGRADLIENLLDAIPESYGDEQLDLVDRVMKYDIPEVPAYQSLSTYQVRVWYKWQETLIESKLDYDQPLEQIARQACDLRNDIRTRAREYMSDGLWADYLMEKDKNKTFEWLVAKYMKDEYYGDALWRKIIEVSMHSRDTVDGLFGLSGVT